MLLWRKLSHILSPLPGDVNKYNYKLYSNINDINVMMQNESYYFSIIKQDADAQKKSGIFNVLSKE